MFDAIGLPEKPVIAEINQQDKYTKPELANYLTLTAAIDYKKETTGPTGIWATTYRLLKYEPWLFEPKTVVDHGKQTVHDVFSDEPIINLEDPQIYAYDNPDVAIWVNNANAIANQYDGDTRTLLATHNHDAPTIQSYLDESREFPFLGGDKINPLWLRLMHEEVHELNNIE